MGDVATTVDAYLAMWNETDPARRAQHIERAHHDQLRFAWELAAPNGAVTVAGIDVGALASDGRLHRITGFFGELPEEAVA